MARVDAAVQLDHGNAFAKFDRLKRKVERAEAEAEAMAELVRGQNTVDDELAGVGDSVQMDVDRELALLKKQVKSS
jgi:phage shock protein A